MNNHQEFVAKTLIDINRDEIIDTLRYKGSLEAYDLLDNYWTFYAMTIIGKHICKFHELNLNKQQIEDSVELAIDGLYGEIAEWKSEWSLRYGDC